MVTRLGGPDVVAQKASVDALIPVDWPGGAAGAIARIADDPSSVGSVGWSNWRSFLAPVLPPHSGRKVALGDRPMHIRDEDWIAMTDEELRKHYPGL